MERVRDFYMMMPCDLAEKKPESIIHDGDYMAHVCDGNMKRYFTRVRMFFGTVERYLFIVWVELDGDTFIRLLELEESNADDQTWRNLTFSGILANDIPTIKNSRGAKIVVRGVDSTEKPIVDSVEDAAELADRIKNGFTKRAKAILARL